MEKYTILKFMICVFHKIPDHVLIELNPNIDKHFSNM